jgi:hypothetical protein
MDDRWWITTPSGRLSLMNRKIEARPYTISANPPGRSGRLVLDEEPGKSGQSIESRPGFRPRQADPWGAPEPNRTEGIGSRPFISPGEPGSVPTFDQREQARTDVVPIGNSTLPVVRR